MVGSQLIFLSFIPILFLMSTFDLKIIVGILIGLFIGFLMFSKFSIVQYEPLVVDENDIEDDDIESDDIESESDKDDESKTSHT